MSQLTALQPKIKRLLSRLGYTAEGGWLDSNSFDMHSTHRFALQASRRDMSVIGAFCLQVSKGSTTVFATPLVYVAVAVDHTSVKKIHQQVWSQGLAPYLLIITPEKVALCPGFEYSDSRWDNIAQWFAWNDINVLPDDPCNSLPSNAKVNNLWSIRALRLRTSIFWRDHSIDVTGRVDRHLLENLEALSTVLIDGTGVSGKLTAPAANGLIGRFLYIFFLVGRGVIDQDWITSQGHEAICLSDQTSDWPADSTWRFLDTLDEIFNGSIFPLDIGQRALIDSTHINLVRRVMGHGGQPLPTGGVQLSFLDVDFAALRVETLSSVYEQFLENLRSGERRRAGAFYTPPFLVDFMLDRVEESTMLCDGTTVLDPAAGSGVFLVGAYRRIVEHARESQPNDGMDLKQIRTLLVKNIYGVERNPDACHVAAFSLYLTMLDYITPRDLTRVTEGEDPEKLFPSLVGTNIFVADFFSDGKALRKLPEKIECIVGNPPWQNLSALQSPAATKWLSKHSDTPIGEGQAAELFIWKALRSHLTPGGTLGFLIPSKSFINPSANKFRQALSQEITFLGIANLSHLRHRLFADAKHAAAGVFIKNQAPNPSDWSWIYSPLSVGQPMAPKGWPWTLMMDKSEIQMVRHSHLANDQRAWFEAFVLRPVDRQIRRCLEDSIAAKRIEFIGNLKDSVGVLVRRGGNPIETGVDEKYLAKAPKIYNPSQESTRDLFDDEPSAEPPSKFLPTEQLAQVKPSYRNRFAGKVLLVPRNFSGIRFVESPVAYTSSTLAIFFDKSADQVTDLEQRFLCATERYLRSKTALYLLATTGRRWLMDRRNVEPADLSNLPIPFTALDDPRVEKVLALHNDALETFLLKSLGLNGDFKVAIEEFLAFRMGFQDGNVPLNATDQPTKREISQYVGVLRKRLDALMGRAGAFTLTYQIEDKAGVGIVSAQFVDIEAPRVEAHDDLCKKSLDHYLRSSTNSFFDSLSISYDPVTLSVSFVKPLEYFRWTIDGAYTDSQHMMNSFMKGSS